MREVVKATQSRSRVRVERGIYRQANDKDVECFMRDGGARFRTVASDLELARAATFVHAGRAGEWRLPMATHNLTKLHRHQLATATG